MLFLAGLSIMFQGCLKDKCTSTYNYTFYRPIYKTKAEVRANIRSNAPIAIDCPGKIYVRAPYIFLNEIDRGIHVIDNSNPAQPNNVTFINIPGNVDIAVKGNTLYADLYTDLVAIDITNPKNVVLKKVVEGVFPDRYYYGFRQDSLGVIASWEKRDTTISDKGTLNSFLKSSDIFFLLSRCAHGKGGCSLCFSGWYGWFDGTVYYHE